MSFLLKRKPKTPQELVRFFEELLIKLETTSDPKKALEDVLRYLRQVKTIVSNGDGSNVTAEQKALVIQELCSNDCLRYMIIGLRRMDFDLRKDVVLIFIALLKRLNGAEQFIVPALLQKHDTLVLLMRGPENEELASSCGKILRECLAYEQLHLFVLYHGSFWNYFEYPQRQQFETIAETVQTLEALLTTNKGLVSEFLLDNGDLFIVKMNGLIKGDNYVLKRQGTHLLNEVLQYSKSFLFNYTDDHTSLKVVMLLLSDKLKNMNLEGFQLLRLFVARPNKSQKVFDILVKNKANFIKFFENFALDPENANLKEERNYVVKEIEQLPNLERVDAMTD